LKDPAATPLVTRKRGCPPGSRNKRTLAALAATAAVESGVGVGGVASLGFAGVGTGGSTSAATTMAYKPWCPPAQQRLSYTSEHGFTTFVVHLRAGCEVRLPLHFRFIDTLGGNPLTRAMVEEGNGGQPLYPVKILHDD
jgi:hypothetical protein